MNRRLVTTSGWQTMEERQKWDRLCMRVVQLSSDDESFTAWFKTSHSQSERWHELLITCLIIGKIHNLQVLVGVSHMESYMTDQFFA